MWARARLHSGLDDKSVLSKLGPDHISVLSKLRLEPYGVGSVPAQAHT